MALTSNNNVTPNETLSPEDIKQIVKDVLGEVRAGIVAETRKQAQCEEGSTQKAMAKAAEKAASVAHARKSRFDTLATKDPDEMTSEERGRLFARGIQCMYHAKMGGKDVLSVAKEYGQESLIKALQATDFDNGGFLLAPSMSEMIIEELVARSVYVRAGPQTVDLPEGGLMLPYENDGADAQWAGEGTEVSAEEVTGGQINLQARKLITVVGVSNDLLRGAPGKSDRFILNSILKGMRTKLDSTLINSSGASSEPKGLDGLVASGNTFNVTAKASLTQAVLVEELLSMQTNVEQNNIDLATANPFYFMSPRTKNYLRAQRATDGRLFPEMDQNQLLGAGFDATSNVSNAVTGSYSEIFFVALDHMILGKQEEMLVDMFDGGTYNNSSGTKRSGISADETAFRVIGKWDHAAGQRGNEISRADQVDWA